MQLSPVALFVYNRPAHTRQTVEALARNTYAEQTELFVFSDGPADPEQLAPVTKVREYIKTIAGFKAVHVHESATNEGLARSIIGGVTTVLNQCGKIIVLEDDIVTSPGFLQYMNDALRTYQDDNQVMHISGYFYPIRTLGKGTHFLRILSCWGWGTWKRAWQHFDADAKVHLAKIRTEQDIKAFNINGHADFYEQLQQNQRGEIFTWAVKWYASWLFAGGYSLFPAKSLTHNIGFDASGTHCGSARLFDTELADRVVVREKPIKENRRLRLKVDRFYQNLYRKNRSLSFVLKKQARACLDGLVERMAPLLGVLRRNSESLSSVLGHVGDSVIGHQVRIGRPAHIQSATIGDYTYVAHNSQISLATIGKFCSIGPNFFCGWGIYPVNGVSTSPMFYSTLRQNGIALARRNKVVERKEIQIGNDVFIGANVTVLDGVHIGDGAIIGAGAVVVEDIPPYAIAGGVPAKVIKYRFDRETIDKLTALQWWNSPERMLQLVEKHFFDLPAFLSEAGKARRNGE